jgi:type VI secretion system secreted protein Hcp
MILLNFSTKIKGDSVVEKHEEWISCDTVQLGVGRSISSSGGGKDRDVSNPSFSELVITKSSDIASPELYYQAIQGKSLGKGEIHFVNTGAEGTSQVYLMIELQDPIVSSYSASSGGDRPTESFTLNFTKISYQFDVFDGNTKIAGTPKKWDVMANKTY